MPSLPLKTPVYRSDQRGRFDDSIPVFDCLTVYKTVGDNIAICLRLRHISPSGGGELRQLYPGLELDLVAIVGDGDG